MRSKPAKPITQLAEPNGGPARLRPNRLGVAAKWLSSAAWAAVALTALLQPWAAAGWVLAVAVGLAIAGVATGAVALRYAWRDRLDSRPAHKAIFLIVVPLGVAVLGWIVVVLVNLFR